LQFASGTVPHPDGDITVEFRIIDSRLSGRISIPPNLEGKLIANGKEISFANSLVI
jgi:hypothetical protein